MSLTRADPSFTHSPSLCLSLVTAGILLKSYIFPLPLNTIETFLLKCKCCGRTFLSLGFYYIFRSSLRLLRELCDWQNYNNFCSRGLYHLTRNLSPAACPWVLAKCQCLLVTRFRFIRFAIRFTIRLYFPGIQESTYISIQCFH